jgi:hypothetical protein
VNDIEASVMAHHELTPQEPEGVQPLAARSSSEMPLSDPPMLTRGGAGDGPGSQGMEALSGSLATTERRARPFGAALRHAKLMTAAAAEAAAAPATFTTDRSTSTNPAQKGRARGLSNRDPNAVLMRGIRTAGGGTSAPKRGTVNNAAAKVRPLANTEL